MSTLASSPPASSPAALSLHGPELLAPAGDWDCARAAVENGADAIYFGLERFNARMRAHNFTESDLPKLMEFLHRRGVKGYVTFNTLVFENEMGEAEQYARTIIAAGVDAAIVQDVGICRLIRALSPDFPIHVSTQMTVTSAGGMEFARELGCQLVVLARECSLKEIEQILSLERAQPRPMPLEVFVHGALCVAYSGQCLTSEALGGRSANRGECAQACRMPYDLIADGQQVALGDRKYLLSPQDLAGLSLIPELKRVGVSSLKIEGRLKTPEYVANITRIYREALSRAGVAGKQAPPAPDLRQAEYEMEMSFSRGMYTGWFGGINNQELVHGRFGKKRGVYLGQVAEVRHETVVVDLVSALKPGDGVVFDHGHPEEPEEGGRVYEIKPVGRGSSSSRSLLSFGWGNIRFARIHPGDKLWKTSDPELERRLRQTFAGDAIRFQRPVSIEVHGQSGTPLTMIMRDEGGHVVRVDSTVPLVAAEKQPLDTARLRDQLGRLGGTPFRLDQLENKLSGPVMLPVSELNRVRRDAAAQLDALRAKPLRWALADKPDSAILASPSSAAVESARAARGAPEITVLVRSLEQLDAVLKHGTRTIYCDFEDPKKYREAVARFRSARGQTKDGGIFVAPPRVFKMGEEWVLNQVRSSDADGWLVRNYDHLKFFAGQRCIGDYSLNIANRLSAAYYKNRFNLERLTASYDLNFDQLEALLRASPVDWFEITLHQHMPMFHMEHCIFCAFLSSGKDYKDCGRPCDVRQVKLRDRVGMEHPVKADAGCRNTVYNARAQTGADHAASMMTLGARRYRLEFVDESPDELIRTVRMYERLLRGEITGQQLWRELKLWNQLGVTRGQIGVKQAGQ